MRKTRPTVVPTDFQRADYYKRKQRRERELRRAAQEQRDDLKDQLAEAQERVRKLESALADQVISE